MAVSVQMPKQGNTVVECLLVEWRVKEGDTVGSGDILCAIETDKASFEVPSTAGGTVLQLLANAGDLVPVLTDIAIIGEPGEDNVVAASVPATAETAKAEKELSMPRPPAAASISSAAGGVGGGSLVSPRGRKLAEKLGVDASLLPGSGPGGRITARDVQAAVDDGLVARASPLAKEIMAATAMVPSGASGIGGLVLSSDLAAPGRTAAVPAEAAPEDVPYKGIRKLIGDRMLQSLADHAQLTMNSSADASGLLALRRLLKENGEAAGLPNITLNDMVCWTVAGTLPSFPEVNAVFDRTGAVIHRYASVNLAVAVDTPRGLMVPVLHDAHLLSLARLSSGLAELAAGCRKGSINPDLLAGGTFTVSNLGGLGVDTFTPIINSPQAAILGVGAIREVPVPGKDGGFAFQPRLGLSLTIDHQVVDGAPAARFLQALVKRIEGIQDFLVLRGMV